jgi:hypothetical protein
MLCVLHHSPFLSRPPYSSPNVPIAHQPGRPAIHPLPITIVFNCICTYLFG